MFDCAAQFAPRTVCRSFATKIGRGCCSRPFLALLLLVGLVASRVAAGGADVPHVPIASPGVAPSSTVAAFNSDRHLDLASVEGGQDAFGPSYSIRLSLTASGRQVFRLIAPHGGVAIEARDVNGDHAVDLVVTAAWSRRPVAVLLNHGHDSFSRAEPAHFPGAFCNRQKHWGSFPHQVSESVDVSSESRSGLIPAAENAPDVRGSTESVRTPVSGFVLDSLLVASLGRAPPFEVSCL